MLLSLNTENKQQYTNITIHESKEVYAIKKMLKLQQDYYNNGDIRGFMQSYCNSEDLIFTSLNQNTTYRWKNTLNLYKNSFPNKECIRELKFKILI